MKHAGLYFFLFGLLIFIVEALTLSTLGLLALVGGICMILGYLLLTGTSLSAFIAENILFPLILALAAIVIFLATNVLRAHARKVQTGSQTLIGQIAVAQEDFTEEGLVFATGEIWTAVNKSGTPIKRDEKLRVIAIDNIKLVVSK